MNYLLFSIPMVSIFALLSGSFVLKKSVDKTVSRGFFACCIAVFVWLFCNNIMYITKDYSKAYIFGKIGYTGVIFIPAVFYHFTFAFLNKEKPKKYIPWVYCISGCLVLSLFFTNHLISGLYKYKWGYYTIAGQFHPGFLFFFITTYLICVFLLFYSINDVTIREIERVRRKYIFWAFFIPTFACIDFIPHYKMPIFPIGYIFILAWLILVAYTILKYHFLDIRIVFTRGMILFFIYAGILGVPLLFAGFARSWLMQYLGVRWHYPPLAVYSILAFLAPYIYLHFQTRSDEKRARQQQQLHQSLKIASKTMIELQNIDRLVKIIPRYILTLYHRFNNKITHVSIFLLDDKKKTYKLRSSAGEKKFKETIDIPVTNYLVKWFNRLRGALVEQGMLKIKETEILVYHDINYWLSKAKNASVLSENVDSVLKELQKEMDDLKAAIILPIKYQDDLLGFLIFGEKTPEMYSRSDIDTFSVLANDSAIVFKAITVIEDLKNAQAHLIQSEKVNTLGLLASSMAHELNNPLTIISGYIQILSMEENDKKKKELLKKVIEQTERSYQIIHRLLNFSRLPKEEIKEIDLNYLADETLELVSHKMIKHGIHAERDYRPVPKIKGNATQIQEVFLNLFVNAIQAMPPGGKLKISTAQKDGIIEIQVSDTGKGIAEEDIENIFNPFFTKGKEDGTGLGLYVVEQIIKLYMGSIAVRSKLGEGTVFIVTFPAVR